MVGRLRGPPSGEGLTSLPDTAGGTSATWFGPQGLAESSWKYPVSILCAVVLAGVFAADVVAPPSLKTVSIALLVTVAAAWLLSARLALAIALLTVVGLVAEVAVGEAPALTVSIEVLVLVLLALATRFSSITLRRLLAGGDSDGSSVAAGDFGLENLAMLIDGSREGVAAVDARGRIRYANPSAAEMLTLDPNPARREDLLQRVAEPDRESLRAAIASSPAAGHLGFRVVRRDGEARQVQASATRVEVHREPLTTLMLRDVTEVRRFEQAASLLAETAAALAVTQPLEQTIATLARNVVDRTHACACAVFLLEEPGTVRLAGSSGLPEGYEAAANRAIKAGADIPVFEAIRTRARVFVENLPERIRTEPELAEMRSVISDVSWQLAIAFPMVHGGRPLGGLAVYFLPAQRPDDATLDFLSTIAGQAASAAEISRLVATGQGQVAEEERHRLSRELHDSLSQRLYGIILGARSAQMSLPEHPERISEALAYVLELADGGLGEMRDIVLQLRPESLEKEGLMAALNRHADTIGAHYSVDVARLLSPEPAMVLDTKIAAYRIAVEALNNVAKHSRARRALLRVEQHDGRLLIEVTDDGHGFDAGRTFGGHFGLQTMRERAVAHGGDLEIRSSTGRGTTVRAWLPAGQASLHELRPVGA